MIDFDIYIDGKFHGTRREWAVLPRIGEGLQVADPSGLPIVARVTDVVLGVAHGAVSNQCVASVYVVLDAPAVNVPAPVPAAPAPSIES